MESLARVGPGGVFMQCLVVLVAMSTMGRGFVETEEFISDLDMPSESFYIL